MFSDSGIFSRFFCLILTALICSQVSSFGQSNSIWLHGGPAAVNDGVLDANPPVISYTPLTNTCAITARTLTATITDVDGVPTAGVGRPVLYWRRNSGAYTAVTGTFAGSNTFTFSFGAGLAGELISYFIVAQDNVGNVGVFPSAGAGGFSTNPPNVATPPTSPSFYVIQTALAAGTYNVGAGQTYLTITDAINAYNNSCLTGAITFVLTDALYSTSEVFPITISNLSASATNTLLIKPNTGTATLIQGRSGEAIFKFNGADFVTIDGSNSGGTTRNLTIINDSASTAATIIWVGSSSASNGATNNTIKNCLIIGQSATTTAYGILSSSAIIAGNPAEAANTSNSFLNNAIQTCHQGIALIGNAAGESGNVVASNVVGSTQATKKMGYRGLVINNQTNVQVRNNTILGIASTFGIGSESEPTAGIIVSGAISGGAVYANTVEDIKNTNVAGWPAYGVALQSSSSASGLRLHNNMINGVTGYGNGANPAYNGAGIGILSGGGYGVLFNSVNLHVNQFAGGTSSALFIGPDITGTGSLDVRNNIFSNRRTNGTNYAVYSSVPAIVFSAINYNDYYSTSFVGYLGANISTLAAWQAATGSDGNSVAVNPIFVSVTNLHLNVISPLNAQGGVISGITTDLDGDARGANPDIGADEFTPPACSGNSGGTAVTDFLNICTSGSVSLSASGFAYGLGIAYQWERSTTSASAGFTDIPGETNPTSANPPVITQTTWYRLRVRCNAGAFGYSNVIQITVYNPAILSSTGASRCGPGTVNLSATGSPTTAIQWYTTAIGGAPVYTGNPFTTPSLAATTTFYAESTYLGSSGTVGPVSPTAQGGLISTQITSWEVTFNVTQATKLLTIDIFPLVAGEFSIIDVYNSAGTVIASVPYTTVVAGGATPQTISMNVSLPVGNGYYLYATGGLPPGGLSRNINGATYPYTSSDIQITGNGFDQTFYMCYYRWRFSNGCSSNPRTAVTATIGTTAALNVTATPSSICLGESTVLNVTSSNTAFTYNWLPGNFVGPTHTVLPDTTTTYTVNATDGTCTATGQVTVTVNPAASAVAINPVSVIKCSSAPPVLLTASGGDIVGVPILIEDFNAGTTPTGWTNATNWAPSGGVSTGTPANSAWTLRGNNYSWVGNTFRSNDLSQFYLSNSDANSGVTRTNLVTPSFSLIGYTGAKLSFWHYYASNNDGTDSLCVEISQNGTTWTNIYSSHFSVGGSINFSNRVVNLNAWINQGTNYIRFRNYGTGNSYWWALDNVSITGENSGAPITWSPTAGLFTNAAGTVAYTGGASSTVYANPSVSTDFIATATPVNACAKRDTVTVTIRPLGAILSPATIPICPSGAATISIALDGSGPWNLTYTDGTTPVTVNGITTSPYTFTVYPTASTTYSLTALSDASCTATSTDLTGAGTASVIVSSTTVSTWLGTSTDWFDLANWCGGVPTSTRGVVIPVTGNNPIIAAGTAMAADVSVANGAGITVSAGATFAFTGNFTNNGTIANDGTFRLNGSSLQTFPNGSTGTITSMNIFQADNPAGISVNRPVIITGSFKPTRGNTELNNAVITLKSTATATANVSALGATAGFTYTGAGAKFSVERYISSSTKKAWRMLAAPVLGTQTINQAWQEGQTPGVYTSTSYGMQIVGPGGTANGFDMNTSSPSLKRYNPATNAFEGVPNTSDPISATYGYMAFIRGDRGSNTFTSPLSATTLRTAGPIKTGNIGPIGTPTAGTYISVGNPYPSAIDFTTTTRTGLADVYYLWDPKLGLYGGYQTFSGPSYIPTPGGGSYSGGNKYIESGMAFFVLASTGPAPHNISFSENAKVDGSFQVARTGLTGNYLRTQLYGTTTDSMGLIDGTLIEFDDAFSMLVDDLDAPKLSNFGENIGIRTGSKTLSIERRPIPTSLDTIYFELGQLRSQSYQLHLLAESFSTPDLTAWFRDKYLATTVAIQPGTSQVIEFAVNTDPASAASDRFSIVFARLIPVPVRFISIKAQQKSEDIIVNWKIENELNVDKYEVEHSGSGSHFNFLGSVRAKNTNDGSVYNFLHSKVQEGAHFYRIRSRGLSGDMQFSEIVQVLIAGADGSISVYPNPVVGRTIGIGFAAMPADRYEARLFGMDGSLIAATTLQHSGGTTYHQWPVSEALPKALYHLEIIKPGGKGKRRLIKIALD